MCITIKPSPICERGTKFPESYTRSFSLDPYGGDNVHNAFFFVLYFLRQQYQVPRNWFNCLQLQFINANPKCLWQFDLTFAHLNLNLSPQRSSFSTQHFLISTFILLYDLCILVEPLPQPSWVPADISLDANLRMGRGQI